MKVLLLVIAVAMLFSCGPSAVSNDSAVESDVEVKKNVAAILDGWHKAAADANYDTYFNAMDSISIFYGTDASENWTKEEFSNFSKPYFDQGKAWSFTATTRNIYLSADKKVAWFDEVLATWMGTCIGSGVLEKLDKEWKIKHYVLSVAIPNDDIDEVIAVKKANDSIFIQELKADLK